MSEQHTGRAIGGTTRDPLDPWMIIQMIVDGQLDTMDVRIINAMVADCTAGSRQIAKTISRPAATVRYRIKRLRVLFA